MPWTGDIRLRATPHGFGVRRQPGPRVAGTDLIVGDLALALTGTIGELAVAAGISPRSLEDVYADVVPATVADDLFVDPAAAALLAAAFGAARQASAFADTAAMVAFFGEGMALAHAGGSPVSATAGVRSH